MKLPSFNLAIASTEARTAAIALASTASDLVSERRVRRKRVERRASAELKVLARKCLSRQGAFDDEDLAFVEKEAAEEFNARLAQWLGAAHE